MRASHNRARIAERVDHTHVTRGTIATNPALRTANMTPLREPARTKRRKGRGPGAVARDSRGRISDWTRSPYTPRGGWR